MSKRALLKRLNDNIDNLCDVDIETELLDNKYEIRGGRNGNNRPNF